jgi:RimJ/RimL family protein N-acetyltransferase
MTERPTVTLRRTVAWRPGARVRLRSKRLDYISPPPAEAAATVAGWFADLEVGRFLAAPPDTPQKAQVAIRRADNRRHFFFAATDRACGRLVGYTEVLASPTHRYARTSSAIGDRAYWRDGYAQEMRAAVVDFLFRAYRLNKVSSHVYGRNVAAIFNNKALGYTLEGVLRQQERDPAGGFRDVLCFALFRDDWLARHPSQST